MPRKKVVPQDEISEAEKDRQKVTARGPGAPTAKQRAHAKARGLAPEIDQNDLQVQIPGVDLTEPTEIEREDPRLGDGWQAKQIRRAHAIYERRAARGEPCRRKVYDKHGKDTGATTSSV